MYLNCYKAHLFKELLRFVLGVHQKRLTANARRCVSASTCLEDFSGLPSLLSRGTLFVFYFMGRNGIYWTDGGEGCVALYLFVWPGHFCQLCTVSPGIDGTSVISNSGGTWTSTGGAPGIGWGAAIYSVK